MDTPQRNYLHLFPVFVLESGSYFEFKSSLKINDNLELFSIWTSINLMFARMIDSVDHWSDHSVEFPHSQINSNHQFYLRKFSKKPIFYPCILMWLEVTMHDFFSTQYTFLIFIFPIKQHTYTPHTHKTQTTNKQTSKKTLFFSK